MTLLLLALLAVVALSSHAIIPALIGAVGALGSAYLQSSAAKKNAQQANTAGMFGGPRVRPMPNEMAAPQAAAMPQANLTQQPKPVGSTEPTAPPIAMAGRGGMGPAQTQGSPAVAQFAQLLARQKTGGLA